MNLQQRSMSSDIDVPDDDCWDSHANVHKAADRSKTYNIQNNLSMQRKAEPQQVSTSQKDKDKASAENFTSDTTTAPKHKRARVSQVGT